MEFETEEDKIGRKEFVDKIVSCVDHLAEDQNICIAIDGEWGSGKSFVMEKLYKRLNKDDSYLVVHYDAWECSFYDEPLFAIFSSILDCAKEKLSLLPGGKKGLKAVGKEIGKDALEELSKKSGKLGNLATFIKGFLKYIGIYKNGATIDTSDERSKEYKSYQSYLKEIQDSLNEYTTHSDYRGKKNKLIVLVDELDRCLPDMQLKILERLHHLFDVKNCAVVCAINAGRVAENMKATYGVDGYEYLRKFFDLTYRLEKSTEIYLKNLFFTDLHNLAVKQCNVKDWKCEPFTAAYYTLRYGSKGVLKRLDNREATRFYKLVVKALGDFGLQKLAPNTAYFIIIALFIRQYLSRTFLLEEEIKKNQEPITRAIREMNPSTRRTLPYYDYIYNVIGFNREGGQGEPYDILTNTQINIAELIWNFDQIVCYSIADDRFEQSAPYYGVQTSIADCKRARKIVLIYGDKKGGATNA